MRRPDMGCCCGGDGEGPPGEGCPPTSGKCAWVPEVCCRETDDEGTIWTHCIGGDGTVPEGPQVSPGVGWRVAPGSIITFALTVRQAYKRMYRWSCSGTIASIDPGDFNPDLDCTSIHPHSSATGRWSENWNRYKTLISFAGSQFKWGPSSASNCTGWGWTARKLVQLGVPSTNGTTGTAAPTSCGAYYLHYECDATEVVEVDMTLTPYPRGTWVLTVSRVDGAAISLATLLPGVTVSEACNDGSDDGAGDPVSMSVLMTDPQTLRVEMRCNRCNCHWTPDAGCLRSQYESLVTSSSTDGATTTTQAVGSHREAAEMVLTRLNWSHSCSFVEVDDCPYSCSDLDAGGTTGYPYYLCDCGAQEDVPTIPFTFEQDVEIRTAGTSTVLCSLTTVVTGIVDLCGNVAYTGCSEIASGSGASGCNGFSAACSGGEPTTVEAYSECGAVGGLAGLVVGVRPSGGGSDIVSLSTPLADGCPSGTTSVSGDCVSCGPGGSQDRTITYTLTIG